MRQSILFLTIGLFLFTSNSQASNISGEAEAGALLTNGNTSTRNLNVKGKIDFKQGNDWKHAASVEAVNTSSNGSTTAERYLANERSSYILNDVSDIFASIETEKDRFSGFDYRYTGAIGYNRKHNFTPNLTMDASIGPGFRQRRPDNGSIENDLIGQFNVDLKWKISDAAGFREGVLIEAGSNGTIIRSLSELKLNIVGNLATKLSFRATRNSDVPVGNKQTDTETAVTLVYSF